MIVPSSLYQTYGECLLALAFCRQELIGRGRAIAARRTGFGTPPNRPASLD